MARARKASDEQIFDAAYRLMAQLDPARWTHAELAAPGRITGGALVQRFGSKRALQVALIEGLLIEATVTGSLFTWRRTSRAARGTG